MDYKEVYDILLSLCPLDKMNLEALLLGVDNNYEEALKMIIQGSLVVDPVNRRVALGLVKLNRTDKFIEQSLRTRQNKKEIIEWAKELVGDKK